jgi:sulfatase modifying factor 1
VRPISLIALLVLGITSSLASPSVVKVAGGEFLPQYGPGGSKAPVKVGAFMMDVTPVTRADYAAFLAKNSSWRKGKVPAIFAEPGYLSEWTKDRYPKKTGEFAVGSVSYFAAAAYCEWKQGRLPSVIEWEFAAQAANPVEGEEILNLVSSPRGAHAVGQSPANRYGLRDLHGMVWEWTIDYNSSFVTSDNRQDGEAAKNFLCGAGAIGATDRLNYPAFIRYAMRGGLRPNFTLVNLGFRCVYDAN